MDVGDSAASHPAVPAKGAAFPELLEYVESVSVGVTKQVFFLT